MTGMSESSGGADENPGAVLEAGGYPPDPSWLAQGSATGVERNPGVAHGWIAGYREVILPVFDAVGVFPLPGIFDVRRDAPSGVSRNDLRLERVRKWIQSSSPYVGALLLCRVYGECALKFPFPCVEQFARTIMVEPERLADAIRIAVFLPPRWLLGLGVSWQAAQELSHEDLVDVSCSGEEPKRVEALMGRLRQDAEHRRGIR
jgi:hypothetical protein